MNASAALGEVTGTCNQAQKENSKREGKPPHRAAVLSKNDGGAAVSWAKKGLSRGPLWEGWSSPAPCLFITLPLRQNCLFSTAICLGALVFVSFWIFLAGVWHALIRLFKSFCLTYKKHITLNWREEGKQISREPHTARVIAPGRAAAHPLMALGHKFQRFCDKFPASSTFSSNNSSVWQTSLVSLTYRCLSFGSLVLYLERLPLTYLSF